MIVYRTYRTPVANACQLAVETQNIPVSSVPNPVFALPPNAGTPDSGGDPTNASVSLGPGETARVTVRVFGLAANAIPANPLKPVAVSYAANTGESQSAASLLVSTLQLPVAIAGTAYSANLQSVGGMGAARAWTTLLGSLPPGFSMNSNTGLVSGTTNSTGSYKLSFGVQDSPPAPTLPQEDHGPITLQVNRLSIAGINASVGSNGSTATVQVKVSNAGPAAASSIAVTVSVVPVSGTASGTCALVTAPSATIPGNGSQNYTYNCAVSGVGSLKFQAQANAAYVNSVASVPANTPLVASNSVQVAR